MFDKIRMPSCVRRTKENMLIGFNSIRRYIGQTFSRKHNIIGCAACMTDVVQWLETTWSQRGYHVQVLSFFENGQVGRVIQITNDTPEWRYEVANALSGNRRAVNVRFLPSGDDLQVEVGDGKWLDKAFSGVIAWTVFAPLILIPVVGACRQKAFIDSVERESLVQLSKRFRMKVIDL